VRTKKGERHHLKGRIVKMEIISNLCAWKLQMKIMQEEHDVPMTGHRGGQTTRVVVGKKLYWLEMKEDVKHFV
jgi:hypothetical protein